MFYYKRNIDENYFSNKKPTERRCDLSKNAALHWIISSNFSVMFDFFAYWGKFSK